MRFYPPQNNTLISTLSTANAAAWDTISMWIIKMRIVAGKSKDEPDVTETKRLMMN